MTKPRTENLIELHKQEAALLAELEVVRQAIKSAVGTLPAEAKDGADPEPAESEEDTDNFMKQVLAELGVRFSSVDIFLKAREMKPGLNRMALKKAVNKLERTRTILKIQPGRGMHPARYRKSFH